MPGIVNYAKGIIIWEKLILAFGNYSRKNVNFTERTFCLKYFMLSQMP